MIAQNTTRRNRVETNPIAAYNDTGDLLMELFYNRSFGDHFVGMVSADELEVHLADGTKKLAPMFRKSQHEVQFRINSRWCSVPAIGSAKLAADCLRNFASDLMRAAEAMEVVESRWRGMEAKRSEENGKAVTA